MYENIFNIFIENKEKIEKLLLIDNQIEKTNITFDEIVLYFKNSSNNLNININKNNLIVTEGEPFTTIDIIKSLINTSNKNILFINRSFVGINKWLVEVLAQELNENLVLDINNNYNNYLNSNLNVVPIGEEEMVKQVLEDFKVQ